MLVRITLAAALLLAASTTALAEEPVSGMIYHQTKSVQVINEQRLVTVTQIATAPGKTLDFLQVWSVSPEGTLSLLDSVDLSTPASRTNRVQVTHHTKLDISPDVNPDK